MTSTASLGSLSTFWDQRAFSIDDVDVLWLDVTLAAMAQGQWADFERRLSEGLACAARADAEGMSPSESVLEEAAATFRYDRDLVSGSEMSAWLESAGLAIDEWMDYITRDVLRRMWTDELDDVLDRFAPSSRQLEGAAVAEGICSGVFDTFARSFGERASLALEEDDTVLDRTRAVSSSQQDAAVRLARQHAHWVTRRPEPDIMARLAVILRVDDAYQGACRRLVSDETLQQAIEANRLEWVQLELEQVSFGTEDAAREAVLCVKADGLSLHEVASLSRRPVERRQMFLADLPPDQRDWVLSADTGNVVGPWPVGDRFEVAVVMGRAAPTLASHAVAERARRAVAAQAAGRAARDRVRRPT